MVFYTQITMEAGEDPQFLDAMRLAHIKGALVGVTTAGVHGDFCGGSGRCRYRSVKPS